MPTNIRSKVSKAKGKRSDRLPVRERILAHQVDMVVDHHERARGKSCVHAAGRIGQDQVLHTQQPEHADRERDRLQLWLQLSVVHDGSRGSAVVGATR